MIFLHLILGLLLGQFYGYTLLFVFACMLPDIDHVYIICKHRLFTKKKILAALKNEEQYGLRFKTPFMHSILGLLLCSLIFYYIAPRTMLAFYFSIAYLSHLLLDWPDIDKKQFLYPLSKKEFSGFLPIWSKQEKIITIFASTFLLIIYFL